jgi:hypothetical protein
MRNDESGHIVVETIGAFIPFVFLVISILSLVQLSATQARIHNALTQTALTISMYSYIIEVIDNSDADTGVLDNINDNFLARALGGNIRPTPFFTLSGVADDLRGSSAEFIIRPLMRRHLTNGDVDGNDYLLSANVLGGIDGLDFTGTTIIDSDENIKITVNYKVAYTFGGLPMPFPNPFLEVTQTVMTKAWLGGSGEGYSDD